MSNQDLIDYMHSIEDKNNIQILGLQDTINSINSTIINLNAQIVDCNNQITILNNDNSEIQSIIAFIPPD